MTDNKDENISKTPKNEKSALCDNTTIKRVSVDEIIEILNRKENNKQ